VAELDRHREVVEPVLEELRGAEVAEVVKANPRQPGLLALERERAPDLVPVVVEVRLVQGLAGEPSRRGT
jgi:hypothetical protein